MFRGPTAHESRAARAIPPRPWSSDSQSRLIYLGRLGYDVDLAVDRQHAAHLVRALDTKRQPAPGRPNALALFVLGLGYSTHQGIAPGGKAVFDLHRDPELALDALYARLEGTARCDIQRPTTGIENREPDHRLSQRSTDLNLRHCLDRRPARKPGLRRRVGIGELERGDLGDVGAAAATCLVGQPFPRVDSEIRIRDVLRLAELPDLSLVQQERAIAMAVDR